jgi:hypothetical protein
MEKGTKNPVGGCANCTKENGMMDFFQDLVYAKTVSAV